MKKFSMVLVFLMAVLAMLIPSASASSNCSFTTVGTTMYLDADCSSDSTIFVPDGFTLDGAGYTITAVDPVGGHFTGGIVQNAGTIAHVTNLRLTTSNLVNVCDAGAARLNGIMFVGASGSITYNTVLNINQGASGCQEGNAIDVRNAPFDGTHPNTQNVLISQNYIDDYQKTGIVANGDLVVEISHNWVGDSATQANLAANTVQIGFGAAGSVRFNYIEGNQWLGASDFVATAVLVFDAGSVNISQNNIRGNADVGIYLFSDNSIVDNNRVFDEGADGPHGDWGIGNWGLNNTVTNNKVKNYQIPYEGDLSGRNHVVGNPNQ